MTAESGATATLYPLDFVSEVTLRDGTRVIIRPIRPEDRQIEKEFVHALSDETRYFRFLNAIRELSDHMLTRFTQIDYDDEMALIVVIMENGREIEIGVARYIINPDGKSCEFAIVIADAWQHKGIGTRLMKILIEAARKHGIAIMEGFVLSRNQKMLALMSALGFVSEVAVGDPTLRRVVKSLDMRPARGVSQGLG
jgi:acetyltransferase